MNRSNKGRPKFQTLEGWGTDLDTRRLQVQDPQVGTLTEKVGTLSTTVRVMEEGNELTALGGSYKNLMANERYVSDRRGYELR